MNATLEPPNYILNELIALSLHCDNPEIRTKAHQFAAWLHSQQISQEQAQAELATLKDECKA